MSSGARRWVGNLLLRTPASVRSGTWFASGKRTFVDNLHILATPEGV